MTPTVPDGPDTELAAIVADLDDLHTEAASVAMRSEGSVIADAEEVRDDVASIRDRLRAVLARPAGGRDLTVAIAFSGGPFADCTLAVPRSELPDVLVTDIGDSRSSYVRIERNGEPVYRYDGEASASEWEHCPRVPADAHVDEDARPAVARTDGQPPAETLRKAVGRYVDYGPPGPWRSRLNEALIRDQRADVAAAPADDTAAPDGWGISLIRQERARQVSGEGHTAKHDATHTADDLATAGALYALTDVDREPPLSAIGPHPAPRLWPWDESGWKPTPNDRVRELTKAGALIAAAIDRLLAEPAETTDA